MKNHRYKFFESDPNVEDDVRVVRPNHEEVMASVWAHQTLVLLFILYQGWST
jgi:hypothetical protein